MFGQVIKDMEIFGGFIPQGKKVIVTNVTNNNVTFKTSKKSKFEVMTTIDKILLLN